MDIVKVFGSNLKNIEPQWESPKKHLPINVVCTARTLVPLNVIAEAYPLKIFSELRMHSKLKHTNFFWRNK